MVVVHDRPAETLRAIIQRYILPGTIILSDCWSGYKNLRRLLDCEHYTVNHSKYFRDPFTGTHTNTIEGTWAHAKRSMPKKGIRDHLLDSYLCKFVWKRQAKANKRTLFLYLLDCIAQQYPLGTPPVLLEDHAATEFTDAVYLDGSLIGGDENEDEDLSLLDTFDPLFLAPL